jgi:hypothetical protein
MAEVVITQDIDDIGRAITSALEHVPLRSLVAGRLVAVKPG